MITTRTLRTFTIETDAADTQPDRRREWLVRRLLALAVVWGVVVIPVVDAVASHR
jgi:hypothetical protein